MKRSIIPLTLAALLTGLGTTAAIAQNTHATPTTGAFLVADASNHSHGKGMSSGHMGHMKQMDAHMNTMKKEMAEIRAIKDPIERKRRMGAHMKDMSAMMAKMHANHPDMSGADQQTHIKLLEKRVDILEESLNQVFEHESFDIETGE